MLRHICSITVLVCCVHIAYAQSDPPAGAEKPPASREAAEHGATSKPAAPAFFRLDHSGNFRTGPVTTEAVRPPQRSPKSNWNGARAKKRAGRDNRANGGRREC